MKYASELGFDMRPVFERMHLDGWRQDVWVELQVQPPEKPERWADWDHPREYDMLRYLCNHRKVHKRDAFWWLWLIVKRYFGKHTAAYKSWRSMVEFPRPIDQSLPLFLFFISIVVDSAESHRLWLHGFLLTSLCPPWPSQSALSY